MNHLIKATNISFLYEGNDSLTLKDISFELGLGQSLGILGPNGGGKSTLMKILSGILIPSSGELEISNYKIHGEKDFPYKLISYIPQSSGLNLSLPIRAHEYLEFAAKSMGIKEADKKIKHFAAKVGIDKKLNYLFKNMSGGEMQRVLLCKALLNHPQILLLDEPTKGLDSQGQDQLLGILKNIKEEHNTAVVIVDHNINQIIRHCDKVICLNKTSHWHDHKDLLTKNVLENIYHCEFEHLLIHEKESGESSNHSDHHEFCDHDHSHHHPHDHQGQKAHSYVWRKK